MFEWNPIMAWVYMMCFWSGLAYTVIGVVIASEWSEHKGPLWPLILLFIFGVGFMAFGIIATGKILKSWGEQRRQ